MLSLSSRDVSGCVKQGDYICKGRKMPKEAMYGISFELFGMITVRKCLELRAVPIVRIALYTRR